MSATPESCKSTAMWCFMAATFVLIASVFARTSFDAQLLANLMLAAGVVVTALGTVCAVRAHRARRSRDA